MMIKEINKKRLLLTILFVFSFTIINSICVKAAVIDVNIGNDQFTPVSVNIGDTGRIIPDMTTISNTDSSNTGYPYYNSDDKDTTDTKDKEYTAYFSSNDTEIITVDNDGNYQALNSGSAIVEISVYEKTYYYPVKVFTAQVLFTVNIDMTNVTLSTDSICAYIFPDYYYAKNKPQYSGVTSKILINSTTPISYVNSDSFSCVSSDPALCISAYIQDNVIYIEQSSGKQGIAVLTITIYGKVFTVNYEARRIGISDQSYLLPKNRQYRITIIGYTGDVTWESSNPQIATVDSNGNVKGKKTGNCIIKAKIDDRYLGCALSVTTTKLKRVTERATYIGTHWKYSQPKRAQKGYYDCSALVWKAYKEKANVTFGTPGYPGNTATESAWCKRKGKIIKGGMTSKRFLKMNVNPGDIMFKSNDMKNKYSTTYHVEMFTGYICNSVSSEGIASISPLWAARRSYYGWVNGSLLARPMK